MRKFFLIYMGITLLVIRIAFRLVGNLHKAGAIVWSACFYTTTESRQFHSAERLTVDDGTCDAAIDIKVTCQNRVFPELLFILIQALQTGSQTVVQTVHQFYSLLQIVNANYT